MKLKVLSHGVVILNSQWAKLVIRQVHY